MLCAECGNLHASCVVRSLLASKDSLDFFELPAYFSNHLLGSTAYCIHRKTAEQE